MGETRIFCLLVMESRFCWLMFRPRAGFRLRRRVTWFDGSSSCPTILTTEHSHGAFLGVRRDGILGSATGRRTLLLNRVSCQIG